MENNEQKEFMEGIMKMIMGALKTPMKNQATEIENKTLNELCNKFIETAEEVISICKELDDNNDYSLEDKEKFVYGVNCFAMQVDLNTMPLMRELRERKNNNE